MHDRRFDPDTALLSSFLVLKDNAFSVLLHTKDFIIVYQFKTKKKTNLIDPFYIRNTLIFYIPKKWKVLEIFDILRGDR